MQEWMRTTQFAVVPEWVIYRANGNAVRMYALLDRHSNRDECFPSLALLAQELDVSQDTARRAIRELEGVGAVDRLPRHREDGGVSSNGYRLYREDPNLPGLSSKSATAAPRKSARASNDSQNERERASLRSALSGRGHTSEVDQVEHVVPKRVLIDGQNVGFDALTEVCGISSRSPRVGEVTKGLRNIRKTFWLEVCDECEARDVPLPDAEQFEVALAEAIRVRANRYRERFSNGVELTPTALAKWWVDVAHDPKEKPFSVFEHLKAIGEGKVTWKPMLHTTKGG